MYSSGYTHVAKYNREAQKKMKNRSKGKGCGYYMRIVFFFSSLIQSLIIVSLVLFLVYGKKQDSASTARIQDLEESFSRLSIETVALRLQRSNLTNLLNATLTNKARNDWDLVKIRHYTNISALIIQEYDKKLQLCTTNLLVCNSSPRLPCNCFARAAFSGPTSDNSNCGMSVERLKLVESNFTQTVQRMRTELDRTAQERDFINLEVIRLRREQSAKENELLFNKQKCKDEFYHSLSGVSNVSKAFLSKIESLFPAHIAFQLSCSRQREQLEQIRNNCTSLSREVEDKFQRYLDSVGERLSDIRSENSRFKAENLLLSEEYRLCSRNRSGIIKEHKQNLYQLQQKHDQDKERLLMDKMRLNGDIIVLENTVKYKSKEIEHLTQKNINLNMSCKTSIAGTSGQSALGAAGTGQLGKVHSGGMGLNFGSSGSPVNKLGSTGLGSASSSVLSSGSSLSLGSIGSAFNKPGSTGLGSSSSSALSHGSSSSLGSIGSSFNKPGSTGLGSSSSSVPSPGSSSSLGSIGSGFNKPASTGLGSSSKSFLSPGSGSNLGSTGSGLNNLGSVGRGSSLPSSGSSSSHGATGSGLNKPASNGGGSSSFGSPSLSSSGIGSNKPAFNARGASTSGLSLGSSGSSLNLNSGGIGSNKPTTNEKSSLGLGSSSGSTGSTSKTGSGSFSWFGFGNNNQSPSKPGGPSGTGKVPSTGNNYGGTGSAMGAGRTSGLGVGSVNIAQHLQELQRIINPPGPEEKQDLSRMLG